MSAFGMLSIPIPTLVRDIGKALGAIKHQRCLADSSATRVFPEKRLRNGLINAMQLHSCMQPVAAVRTESGKRKIVNNPMWDCAPPKGFHKSKRICGLVTTVVRRYGTTNKRVERLLQRLAINIWSVSMRHFNGLCRSIRAELRNCEPLVHLPQNKPEAPERFGTLTGNPATCRVFRYTRYRICPHSASFAALRLSTNVDLVRLSLKCRKCTVSACAARWFSIPV